MTETTPNPTAPHRPPIASTGDSELDAEVARFVAALHRFAGPRGVANEDLAEQMLRIIARQFTLDAQDRPEGFTVDRFTGDVINLSDVQRDDEKLNVKIIEDATDLTRHMAKFPGSKAWICGSARTKEDSSEFTFVRDVAAMLAAEGLWVTNGGGPGAMRAATLGAGDRAVQIGIELPFEDPDDDEITVTLAKFFIRKLGMLRHGKVVAVAPGGLGTDEELKEVLTLIQTGKQPAIPVFLFDEPGTDFWGQVEAAFEVMIDAGKMSPHDRSLFRRVQSVEELRSQLRSYYAVYHSHLQIEDAASRGAGTSRSWINMRLQSGATLRPDGLATLAEEFADIIPEGGVTSTVLAPKELRRIERGLGAFEVVRALDPVLAQVHDGDWSGIGSVEERHARLGSVLGRVEVEPESEVFIDAWRTEFEQPRIGFWFNDRGYARLGEFIERVNDLGIAQSVGV